jgi:excinuclease ABC subunit B
MAYNTQHHITPTTVTRSIEQRPVLQTKEDKKSSAIPIANIEKYKQDLLKAMKVAADNLEFEEAARLRDELKRIEGGGR